MTPLCPHRGAVYTTRDKATRIGEDPARDDETRREIMNYYRGTIIVFKDRIIYY